MIIDTHSHHVPEAMLDDLVSGAASFPSVDLLAGDGKYRLAFAGGKPTRPVMPGLRTVEPRLAWMEEQAVDYQVCAGWLDSFGYGIPAGEGLAWSRFVNEHLKRAAGDNEGFLPLATVPLQDGETAARALEEAMSEGFPGAMIGTQPRDGSGKLDDPDLDPFWQAASDLGATLYIHPDVRQRRRPAARFRHDERGRSGDRRDHRRRAPLVCRAHVPLPRHEPRALARRGGPALSCSGGSARTTSRTSSSPTTRARGSSGCISTRSSTTRRRSAI